MTDQKTTSRRPSARPPSDDARRTARRPMARAGVWAQDRWRIAGQRIRDTKFKKPSRKTTYGLGGGLLLLAVAIAILVAIWDWNWFRRPVERLASAQLHREVTIAGDLDAHLWSWTPQASAERIRIANPAWAGKAPMGQIARMTVQVKLLPLLIGRVELPLLRFDQPNMKLVRNAQGRANWVFDENAPPEPLKLPPITSFIIKDGDIRYDDTARGLSFLGTINAAEKLGGGNRGFELSGQGRFNRQPFALDVTGGPLLNIERTKPYPFNAEVRAGSTYITARGAVNRPFDFGDVYANTTIRGQDLADLYLLTGVGLPNTPPYNLRGRIVRDRLLYKVTGLNGRVGDSDLAGTLSVQLGGARPMLKADLTTRSLDFDDLGALFGGAPSTGAGETASAGQQAVAQQLNAEQRLFPDTTLATDRIRAIDANVSYKALSIRDTPIHLKSASVKVKLDNGLLRAEPLQLDLPQGKIAGYVQLNARKATPVTDLDLRLSNARIEQLIPIIGDGPPPLVGSLVGRARLTGAGNSVHKAFANADGEVMVVAPNGEIRKAFAELIGINIVKGLGLLLSDNQDKTELRCAVAHFDTKGGIMTADRIIFDTGPVLGTGSGTINLATERMDFRLKGHPKKFRLVRLLAPITVKGPIRAPKPGVEAGGAVAQGGVALAIGTLLSPLAAVLPFVDPGLAKDAACASLVAQAGAEGAPVKSVKR